MSGQGKGIFVYITSDFAVFKGLRKYLGKSPSYVPRSLVGRGGWLGLLCLGDKDREAWPQGREARWLKRQGGERTC